MVKRLGKLKYILAATPEFYEKNFKNKNFKQALTASSAVIFDKQDKIHQRYLSKHFKVNDEPAYHYAPSLRLMEELTRMGYGYTLVPEMNIAADLKNGKLLNICPDTPWHIPVYMHYWAIENKQHKQVVDDIIMQAKMIFASNASSMRLL